MNRQHYLDAIETVLAWNLPEEAFANAITQQVFRDMDLDTENTWGCYLKHSEIFH